jgi:dihydroxyacetone kinase DhaKLM complex PTS-EIIA-like component DhaM
VDKGSGVVVLADLGSAVLTARSVLADGRGADVILVDAPLVEGAVAAAVIAATGADLATVRAAAEEARDARKL